MGILVLAYSMCRVILIFEWLLPVMFFTFLFQHRSIHVFCVHESELTTSMICGSIQVPGVIVKICDLNR